MRIRPVAPADVPALAALHVRCWRGAYEGLVPAEALARFDPDEHAARWAARLAERRPGRTELLAEDGGGPVGFVNYGDQRGEGGGGEIYAIYVDPERWGTGAGHALMTRALEDLRGRGVSPVRLWALDGNERARRFYLRHGFSEDGESSVYDFFGAELDVVRYTFDG
ncbi:N-acetyltransferase [Actinorhabdospora filicis]|uniref:N-acetyltransferase n=1 Tax=Actinorhabdospora filicis TaxID=1785913 RepID=A0A9W6W181_9ACTN|nr:GNAT family N-acetyltransferase [Actinorhabdospora filicis]GLZ75607.1 N-acetyltransferase [Actinorhabdospora filicis]